MRNGLEEMSKIEEQIRVIVSNEGDVWVAQCLEYDIGAQANDLADLCERFVLTFISEATTSFEINGVPLDDIPAAPEYYFDLWENRWAGGYSPVALPQEISYADTSVDVAYRLAA